VKLSNRARCIRSSWQCFHTSKSPEARMLRCESSEQ